MCRLATHALPPLQPPTPGQGWAHYWQECVLKFPEAETHPAGTALLESCTGQLTGEEPGVRPCMARSKHRAGSPWPHGVTGSRPRGRHLLSAPTSLLILCGQVLAPAPYPRSRNPQKFTDPSSFCRSNLLAFPNSRALWWMGYLAGFGLLPSHGWQLGGHELCSPGEHPRRVGPQASRVGSALTAEPDRHRAHKYSPGPPASSTPGGRPSAAPDHTPPTGPRWAPPSPSCCPGAQAAGTRPCSPSMGRSAPKGSPPARTGWHVVSGAPRHPTPTHSTPSQRCPVSIPQGPPLPPPPAPSHQLKRLHQGPGLQHLGQQHMLGFTQCWGETLGKRSSGRPSWASPYPCPLSARALTSQSFQ